MKDRVSSIIEWMGTLRNEKNLDGMQRFGINTENAFGISTPTLMSMARELGKDQPLALALWKTGIHEAMIIAAMVSDPAAFTPELMDSWCEDFDSWDICDQVCMKVFRYTPHAREKIYQWAVREEEFVRRAAFALMATCAVIDKTSKDEQFEPWFDLIAAASDDERNFVKKAVNWALRQLGKKSPGLWHKAIAVSEELMLSNSRSARWIAADATRELTGEKTFRRLKFE
ncbi:MAG: DNA alkylation repair protein [Rikenellaceae bacterium]|nr:DNA alkylation repair protein [Rikenellaceae bacterium]